MRPIDADALKRELMKSFNCEDATKYGNRDAKQQAHSYSTIMLYEVSDIIEDTIDNAPTITPEEFKPLIDSVVENIPRLIDAVIENLLTMQDSTDNAAEDFERLKSAIRQAKWEVVDDPNETICCGSDYRCTNCRDVVDDMPVCMGKPLFRYCPNCGAEMEGDNNEDNSH